MTIINRRSKAEDSGEVRTQPRAVLDGSLGHATDSPRSLDGLQMGRNRGDSMTSPPSAPISLALACTTDSFWERWCRNASPEQRNQILPAATSSGLVQIHHLPVAGLQATRNAIQNLIAGIVAKRP